MAAWHFKLVGQENDLRVLSRQLSAGQHSIVGDKDGYWLKLADSAVLEDPDKVRKAALCLIRHLNGIQRMNGLDPIAAGTMLKRDDGSSYIFGSAKGTGEVRAWGNLSLTVDGNVVPVSGPTAKQLLLDLAQRDEAVAQALCFFGGELNWINLYKVYEVIRKDVGGHHKLVKNGWTTKEQCRCFTHTANSPDVLGEGARHGVQMEVPPLDPMLLKEAIGFIRVLLDAWTRSKLPSQLRE